MAEHTGIEWCDATFNPWWGCERVSPACAHCYAEGQANRFADGVQLWGDGHEFRFFGDKHWQEPLKWAQRLPAKLGRRPRVFCASMADVFEERDELASHRGRLFDLIDRTPELDWLILTKRPEFAREVLTRPGNVDRWANVWMGVSIENARYTWRADVLREIPAAVRFISAEPLLGSLFPVLPPGPPDPPTRHMWGVGGAGPGARPVESGSLEVGITDEDTRGLEIDSPWRAPRRAPLDLTGIDWVIAGGESGASARPSHPDWFRELRDACLNECVLCMAGASPCGLDECEHRRPAFFFKQWGEWANGSSLDLNDRDRVVTYDGKVRTWPEWREQGYAVGAGHARPVAMHRAGKRNAGRELDGRTWDEFPQSAVVPAEVQW
jgi:protein gp37